MSQDALRAAYTQMTSPTLAWPESLRAPITITWSDGDDYTVVTGHIDLQKEDNFLSFQRKIRAAWPSRALRSTPTTILTIIEAGEAGRIVVDESSWWFVKNTILLLWHDKGPGAAKWLLASEEAPPTYEDSQLEQALLRRAEDRDGWSERELRGVRLRRRDRFRKWLRNQMRPTEWDHWRGEYVIPIY